MAQATKPEVRDEPDSHPGLQSKLACPFHPHDERCASELSRACSKSTTDKDEADELYGGRPLAGRCSGLCHPGASMREKMGTQRRS